MIKQYGNPVLRAVTEKVVCLETAQSISKQLAAELINPNAVGIAAPQLGISLRMIAVKLRDYGITVMINPRVIKTTDKMQSSNEGCLSIPGVTGKVQRPWGVNVEYCDEIGNTKEMILDGLDAACVMHEIDHLDGVLFTDHLTGGQKRRVDKKLAKMGKK